MLADQREKDRKLELAPKYKDIKVIRYRIVKFVQIRVKRKDGTFGPIRYYEPFSYDNTNEDHQMYYQLIGPNNRPSSAGFNSGTILGVELRPYETTIQVKENTSAP